MNKGHFTIAAAALLGACASAPEADGIADEDLGRGSAELYANPASFWMSKSIPVCWATPGHAEGKEWVRDAVVRTWSRRSRLVFTGWNDCAPESTGVRITVENLPRPLGTPNEYGWPRVVGDLGPGPTLVSDMRLSFDYGHDKWVECRADAASRERCTRAVAVHEFGHSLGFQHEQYRPDAILAECVNRIADPNERVSVGAGIAGAMMYGPWNRNGVMSYCADRPSNGGVLSPIDIVALQRTQGRRPAGTLGTADGRCLSVNGAVADFTPVRMAACRSASSLAEPTQRWNLSLGFDALRAGTAPQYLDVDGPDAMVYPFVPIASQVWTLRGGLLHGLGDLCIAPKAGTVGELSLQDCAQGADKRFTLFHDASVRLTASPTLCLAMSEDPGARVVLAACANDPRQRWMLGPNGSIRPQSDQNRCVEVMIEPVSNKYSSDRFDGTPGKYDVSLSPCHDGLSQAFSFEGEIVNELDNCLTAGAGGDTSVRAGFCDYSDQQRWLYDW